MSSVGFGIDYNLVMFHSVFKQEHVFTLLILNPMTMANTLGCPRMSYQTIITHYVHAYRAAIGEVDCNVRLIIRREYAFRNADVIITYLARYDSVMTRPLAPLTEKNSFFPRTTEVIWTECYIDVLYDWYKVRHS